MEDITHPGAPGCLGEKRRSVYVFESKVTKGPIQNVRRSILSAVKQAGITKRVHPHLFRHSFATHMMVAGVSLRIVQQMLGHADIETTEWYSHVAMGHMRDAMVKMGVSTDNKPKQ